MCRITFDLYPLFIAHTNSRFLSNNNPSTNIIHIFFPLLCLILLWEIRLKCNFPVPHNSHGSHMGGGGDF